MGVGVFLKTPSVFMRGVINFRRGCCFCLCVGVFIPRGFPYVVAGLFVEERSRRSAVGRVAAVRPAGGDPVRVPRDSGLFTPGFSLPYFFAVTWLCCLLLEWWL